MLVSEKEEIISGRVIREPFADHDAYVREFLVRFLFVCQRLVSSDNFMLANCQHNSCCKTKMCAVKMTGVIAAQLNRRSPNFCDSTTLIWCMASE